MCVQTPVEHRMKLLKINNPAVCVSMQGQAPLRDRRPGERGPSHPGEMLRPSLPADPPRPHCGGGTLLQDRLQGESPRQTLTHIHVVIPGAAGVEV